MQSETRQDKILAYLIKQTQALKLDSLPDSLVPVQTAAIAQALGIRDNNVSSALAALHRAGKLVRIGGRPVSYLSLPHLEERLGRTLPTNRYGSVAELLEETSGPPVPSPHEPPGVNAPSLFNTLIGSEGSLSDQVRLAKSAMLYPPHGLHVLITGPTGVGKSLFARAMFDYALKSGHLAADKVLVTFNCANYADNPQLLLSQLFGHVKGAFTGADRERRGLADLADGSILFLDEIHRLSPEGQEKMFLLMDQGIFHRLGESEAEHHANILIVGATTAEPQQAMLDTFLRRIPVHITLPSLLERPLQERLELVLFFLWREARNLKMRLHLESGVLNALCYYKCAANIGQLSSDIKLICASAYYDYLAGRDPVLRLRLSHLTDRISNGLFVDPVERNSLLESYLTGGPVVLDGSDRLEDVFHRYIRCEQEVSPYA